MKRAYSTMLTSKFRLSFILTAIFLSGCTSTVNIREYLPLPQDNRNYSDIYLRGVFNWWEAEPAYLLTDDDNGRYFVDVKLIADGQPYDFRFADNVYTSANNCGAPDISGQTISEAKSIELHCDTNSGNLKFIPSETGTYRFLITPGTVPDLIINQL